MTEDVIVITADSLRADHCGWQDEATHDGLTPCLTELASKGLSFTSAIAPGPRTPSSIPVSHTGVPFSQTEYDISNYSERVARVGDHVKHFETISEWIREQGYTTIAFTANPWTSVETNFDSGFDEFVEVGKTGGEIRSIFSDTRVSNIAKRFDQWLHKDSYFSQWRTFYGDLHSAIKQAEKPVFVWAFLLDAHNPYLVPRQDRKETSAFTMWSAAFQSNNLPGRKTRSRTARKESVTDTTKERLQQAYRDCVRSIDTFVAQIRKDMAKDTTILFYSDHGEAFGEHDSYGHEQVLYEENIHVPCVVYDGQTNDTVTQPVSTINIPEIIKSLVLGDDPKSRNWTTEYAVARTEDDNSITFRGERWKYIQTETTEELYDLQNDPNEETDLSEKNTTVLSEFQTRCTEYRNSLPRLPKPSEGAENEQMREHLQSLGYLQE